MDFTAEPICHEFEPALSENDVFITPDSDWQDFILRPNDNELIRRERSDDD